MADLNVAIRLSATDQASPAIAKVSKQVAGIGSAAEESSSKIGGLTSVLGKVGLAAMGVTAVAGAFAGLGKSLIDPIMAASDLDESMNKVQVVFGQSSKTVTDFAKTAAQGLGTSQQQALEAAGTFGNLFVSMGLGQKQAGKLSTEILTLGADLASFNNIDPTEALDKLRAGLVGESEPLRALGVNLNEDAVAAEAMRLGLAKSKKEITDSAKVQARYSLILQQTKTAQGDFARTSTGMANSLRIIKASFADLQTQIGSRLLPVIAPLVSGFARLLPQAMDALAPILDRVGQRVTAFATGIGTLVENVRTKGLLPALQQLGRDVLPGLQAAFAQAGDLAGSLVSWLRDQVGRINWSAVWSGAVNVGQGLVARLGTITGDVVAWLKAQWGGIAWSEVWASVRNVGQALAGGIGSIVDGVTTWLTETWKGINWEPIWKAVEGHGAALVKALAPITADVEEWLVKQFKAIDWPGVWTAAQVGMEMPRSLIRLIDALPTGDVGEAVGRFLVRAIRDAVRIATGAGGGFDGVGPLMVAGWVREMVDFPGTLATAARGKVVEGLERLFTGAVAEMDLTGAMADLARKVTTAIAGIYPIKIGPLTLSLSGVSVNVTGITGAAAPAGGTATGGGSVPAFAHGGSFRVGGSGGTDSQLVAFRASPGEVVAVGHARRGGAPVMVNQTFHVANRSDAEYLADVLPDALARALEKARSQQGLPVVSGLTRFN